MMHPFRPRLLPLGLLLAFGLLSSALLTAAHVHANDAAYYLVVQHDPSAASQTTLVSSSGQNSITTVQLGTGTTEIGCARYASSSEAEAAAADHYAGQRVQVVLAADALHALAQVAGITDDVLAVLPPLADADLCTP